MNVAFRIPWKKHFVIVSVTVRHVDHAYIAAYELPNLLTN